MNNADESADELRWMGAIWNYLDGYAQPLLDAIRDPSLSLTEDARVFLADLALGKVKRKEGRPDDRHGKTERMILADVFAAWDQFEAEPRNSPHGTPKDRACHQAAGKHGITEGAVRRLVEKYRASGFTRENWRRWGRPDFTNT